MIQGGEGGEKQVTQEQGSEGGERQIIPDAKEQG